MRGFRYTASDCHVAITSSAGCNENKTRTGEQRIEAKCSIECFCLALSLLLALGQYQSYVQESDVTNPHHATDNTNVSGSALPHASESWIPLSLLTFAGLILGAIGYIAIAVTLEIRHIESEPVLSYGQQAVLISAPLCAIMCAMIGMSFGLMVGRQAFFGTVTLIVTGLLGGLLVNSMWVAQIAQHGRDYSEIVLYYPPMSVALASLLISIPSGFVAYQRRKRST